MQLDTGALPNVISLFTLERVKRLAPQKVKFIALNRPITLKLADNKLINTLEYMVQINLMFADLELKIPFHVIDCKNNVGIIGRLSMKVLGIQPLIKEGYAYCKPPNVLKRATLDFLTPEEYYGQLIVTKIDLPKKFHHEAIINTKKRTKAIDWMCLDPEDRDNGPEVFKKKWKKTCDEMKTRKLAPDKRIDEVYEQFLQIADVFSKYPGAYNGRKVEFQFIDEKAKTPNWRGEKFKPSIKMRPGLRHCFKVLETLGYIRRSKTPYINTLAPVVKKSGEIRPCIDPDELNARLKPNYTEPPPIETIINDSGDAKLFCTLDFVWGFMQLVLSEFSSQYTGFQFEGQVYEFTRLPYGLKISAAEFIAMVNEVIPDRKGVTKYVDDVLLRAADFETMVSLLWDIINLIRDAGLKLNPNKTELFQEKTEHLGFVLAHQQISKQKQKLDKFEEFIQAHTRKGKFSLKNEKEILALVGLTGLYSRFIPTYQEILAPIYRLTTKKEKEKNKEALNKDKPLDTSKIKSKKNLDTLDWGPEQDEAFNRLRAEYEKDFKLMPPIPGHELYLETMVTTYAMNAVLFQKIDGENKIIMFTSYSYKPHQRDYTIIDKEMQALVTTIKKLSMWLHGEKVHVRTDLKAIVQKFRSMVQTHRKAAAWITELNGYDLVYDLKAQKTKLFNIVAPELTFTTRTTSERPSKLPVNFLDTAIQPYSVEFAETQIDSLISFLKNIHQDQKEDKICGKIMDLLEMEVPDNIKKLKVRQANTAKKFKIIVDENNNKVLYRILEDDTIVPYLPQILFYDVVDFLHDEYGHVGAAKLEIIFKRLYFYPNAIKYIKEITNSCIICKINKNYGLRRSLEYAQIEAYSIGDVISTDLFGPVANESGNPKYLLVAKDVFTSRIWIRAITDIKKQTVVDAMATIIADIENHDIQIRKIITDNGTQFISDSWKNLLNEHGIKIGHTTTYSPQASLVERSMKTIAEKLRVKINTKQDPNKPHFGWDVFIGQVELELNNSPTSFGFKPFEAWGINDIISSKLPTSPTKFNFREQLRKLRETAKKNDIKSVTSEQLLVQKLDQEHLIFDKDGYVRVTADGACSKNGNDNAIAGFGICFSTDSSYNVSERIEYSAYPKTNNLAELIAIKRALEILIFNKIKKVKLFTDSLYATKALNDTVKIWMQNNWKNSSKKPVKHKDLFLEILDLKKQFDSITIEHVFARQYEYTNIIADQLAKKAVYQYDTVELEVEKMTDRQTIENYIREKRRLLAIHEETLFNKQHGDPTPLEEGDLVLLTAHRQSCFNKGTSKKLYAKRHGPFIVKERKGHNCYLVVSVENPTEERIVNIRQILLFMNRRQREAFEHELCLQSRLNHKTIEDRIKEFLTLDDQEEGEEIDIRIDNKVIKSTTKLMAEETTKRKRGRPRKQPLIDIDTDIDDPETEVPSTSGLQSEEPKRKRGRPRKHPIMAQNETTDGSDQESGQAEAEDTEVDPSGANNPQPPTLHPPSVLLINHKHVRKKYTDSQLKMMENYIRQQAGTDFEKIKNEASLYLKNRGKFTNKKDVELAKLNGTPLKEIQTNRKKPIPLPIIMLRIFKKYHKENLVNDTAEKTENQLGKLFKKLKNIQHEISDTINGYLNTTSTYENPFKP